MKDFKVYQASGYLTKLVTDASDVRKEYEEISGSLVQFDTPISAPLEILSVDINPVQDLHGQDAPYPAGGGRNVLNIADTLVGNDWLVTNITYAIRLGQTFYVSASITNLVGSMQIQVEYTKDGTTQRIFGNSISTASGKLEVSGAIQAFDENTGVYLVLKNQTSASVSNFFMTYSSDHSYSPYSNICPITGWTGVNIYHSGEDTSNPTVYTVSWQDEAGTVYGGTVDVTSGLLTINKNILAFNSLTWTWDQQYSRFISNAVPDVVKGQSARLIPSICSAFPVISDGRTIGNVPDNSVYWADTINSFQLCVKTSLWTTPSDFLDDMGNETIVYPIDTPIEIQITPEEINTLIGVNNIWADTGDVSVKYRTH